jgi:multiple sugar transport system permease protein
MAANVETGRTRWWQNAAARSEAMAGYLFISPYLIITIVFTLGVLLFAIYISFTSFDLFTTPEWRGLENYRDVLSSTQFQRGIYNVAWYAIVVTPIQTAIAIFLAVLLNAPIRARRFFRTVFYAPSVTSSIVISMIFLWLYQSRGFINYIFNLLGWQGSRFGWTNDPRGLFDLIVGLTGGTIPLDQWYLKGPSVAMMAIMAMNIFTTAPTFMVMFLAALQDIPGHIYEAAALDGAVGWRRFRNITLPLLRPTLLLVLVLSTIGTFQVFDQIQQMTEGGPLNTTLTPVFLIYTEALGKAGPPRMGLATAMAFILAAIIFVFTFIQRRYIEKGTEQY